VTEAGLASKDTPVMKNLYELLEVVCELRQQGTWSSGKKLYILDMDNAPNNGDRICEYMNELAAESETTCGPPSDPEKMLRQSRLRSFLLEKSVRTHMTKVE
jgi:hemolysin-activating ACP:hemolysin acyltransferase